MRPLHAISLLMVTACAHPALNGAPSDHPLGRRYRRGDRQQFEMTASHEDPRGILRYSATANTTVATDTAGRFTETVDWSALTVNGAAVPLTPANSHAVQSLSLDPRVQAQIPNLRAAHPSLIGPMLDLMTFYVDLQLAAKQSDLVRPGDHRYVSVNFPASWADGQQVILGQDAVDFDLTLASVDRATNRATLVVRHLPPPTPAITVGSDWMKVPVGPAANNWVQVVRAGDRYVAAIGQETFDVTVTVSLSDGRLLSATMVNPVEVMERVCSDRALEHCDAPRRYKILRNVSVLTHTNPTGD
jgi:hypothetical protein